LRAAIAFEENCDPLRHHWDQLIQSGPQSLNWGVQPSERTLPINSDTVTRSERGPNENNFTVLTP